MTTSSVRRAENASRSRRIEDSFFLKNSKAFLRTSTRRRSRAIMGALLSVRRGCVAWLLLLIAGTVPSAQTPAQRQAAPPASPGARALNAGQYDEVERLLKASTDPASIALRARAQIAQGHYQDARTLLTSVASAQPDSDAALELGLLELYLGQRAD